MALIIAVSAMPSAFAMGFDLSNPASNCQLVTLQYSELDAEENKGNKHGADCRIDSSCISYCPFASVLPSAPVHLMFRDIILKKTTLVSNDTIITRYPQLLKRPPKV